ncbi:hypothetical protein GCK72_000279 [Caenorhabditis remanei]|uniref:F-box domain-containing protein n=1 Tax=Caenorhabditis remanei TaxID=31234 RepID=A0A6A5HQ82_CAERE|nr:hypothetical protein GCK72_000279 [Caenorhabditis remanei]KAF1768467.1 hypothetical protein GCK72_000279 [Caenorhabditis remanei]
MSAIPLLKLPILCINEILINTDIISLVNFCLQSEKCRRFVNFIRTSLTGLHVDIKNEMTEIRFISSNGHEGSWFYVTDNETVPFDGSNQMDMCFDELAIASYHNEQDIQSFISTGINFFSKELFRKPILNVYLHPDDFPESRRPFYEGFNECEEIHIQGEKAMRNEDLKGILENLEFKKACVLDIPVNQDFKCNLQKFHHKILRCDRREGGSCDWITRDVLLSLKCVTRIYLVDSVLTAADCKTFFNDWYRSDETNFEMLHIQNRIPLAGLTFEDIPSIPWDEELRGQYFRDSETIAFDCSDGTDYLRRDGSLCTIRFTNLQLFFGVWKNRFPDISDTSIIV